MTPTPADIKSRRLMAGLTQTQAAALVGTKLRGWQYWEAGARHMPSGLWELFVIKTQDKNKKTLT